MRSGGISILLAAGLLVAMLSQGACAEDRVNVARSGIDIAFDVEVLDVPGTRIEQVLTSDDADVRDSDRGLALGYVMNKMHAVSNIGPRIMRLIDSVYACI